MSQERRRSERVEGRVPLSIADPRGEFQAETRNLSAAGVYCTVKQFIPPMTKLQLAFELPDGARQTRVRCEGVVVRVEPVVAEADRGQYNLAIYFNELSEQHRAAIGRFVQQRLAAGPSHPKPHSS
jgi:hypothetical protein